jgi:hypothetical protein
MKRSSLQAASLLGAMRTLTPVHVSVLVSPYFDVSVLTLLCVLILVHFVLILVHGVFGRQAAECQKSVSALALLLLFTTAIFYLYLQMLFTTAIYY